MSLISLRKNQKVLLAVISFLLLVGIVFTLFHHHADGVHNDCAVCHFLQQIVGFFALAIVCLLGLIPSVHGYFRDKSEEVVQTLFVTELYGRAPPAYFC